MENQEWLNLKSSFLSHLTAMKIQYCSDLHLEFPPNSRWLEQRPLKVAGEVLVLAGDIVPLRDEFLTHPFFGEVSKNYRQVFWVPGNHEFYYSDIQSFGSELNKNIYGNINIVNNVQVVYEGIRFLFTTLWSHIREANQMQVERSVADFDCITSKKGRFRVSDYNQQHLASLAFLEEALVQKNGKTVVVTHHLPSFRCKSDRIKCGPVDDAFYTDLDAFVGQSNVSFWIHGHSHYNHPPVYTGNTILLSNQLGYVELNEQGTFRNNAYFSV